MNGSSGDKPKISISITQWGLQALLVLAVVMAVWK